jgi:ankyrin repeat protein
MLAIPTKNMKLIKYLIRQGINLNISDRNGENALSLSLRFQNDWLSEYLFEKGCRLTVISPPALNPLQENLRKRIENWKNSKKMIVAYLKNKIKLT